ncbi:hypothetical protein C7B61_05960 [filamentous cyanobacterium CCP1]|nr:hypothetical protein C7B61_05960 [filamentous cyanobacterium CCP1]
MNELRQRIKSVEPEFRQLREIQSNFRQEIIKMRDERANMLAESVYNFISSLDETFVVDFKPYMPDLNFLNFLRQGKRREFEQEMKERFQKYLNDRMAEWSKGAERDIKDAFSKIALSASQYGTAYGDITDTINDKLSGGQITIAHNTSLEERYPGWARFATGAAAFFMGDIAGAAGAGMGAFNWKGVLVNLGVVIGANIILLGVFEIVLTPVGAGLLMALSGTTQMEFVRRKFVKSVRTEMKRHLSDVARQKAETVHEEVKNLLNSFDIEVSQRMDEDIESRQAELDKLLEQKEKGEYQRETEIRRLKDLENQVYSEWQGLESAYDQMID